MDTALKRVLIVDDDVFLRDMYAKKFTDMQHEVETVPSAQEAEEVLKRDKFDLVLLDLVMPGTDGFEFLGHANEEGLFGSATLVVLTNQSRPEDMEKAESLGANGYIVKASAIPTEVVVESIKIAEEKPDRMVIKQ